MGFKNNRISIEESLKDLRQKLTALDVLMHNNALLGDPVKNSDSVLKNYSKSNPFTSIDKSITN